jgi:hypothetical protein
VSPAIMRSNLKKIKALCQPNLISYLKAAGWFEFETFSFIRGKEKASENSLCSFDYTNASLSQKSKRKKEKD